MVGLGRFELPTHGLGNRCSIHLSYRPEVAAPNRLTQNKPRVGMGAHQEEYAEMSRKIQTEQRVMPP